MRVLPYKDVVLRILHHEVFEQEIESLNCPLVSHNILDPVYSSFILLLFIYYCSIYKYFE